MRQDQADTIPCEGGKVDIALTGACNPDESQLFQTFHTMPLRIMTRKLIFLLPWLAMGASSIVFAQPVAKGAADAAANDKAAAARSRPLILLLRLLRLVSVVSMGSVVGIVVAFIFDIARDLYD